MIVPEAWFTTLYDPASPSVASTCVCEVSDPCCTVATEVWYEVPPVPADAAARNGSVTASATATATTTTTTLPATHRPRPRRSPSAGTWSSARAEWAACAACSEAAVPFITTPPAGQAAGRLATRTGTAASWY